MAGVVAEKSAICPVPTTFPHGAAFSTSAYSLEEVVVLPLEPKIAVVPCKIGPLVSVAYGPQQAWIEPSGPMRQTLWSARAKKRREPSVANSVNAGLPAGARATTLPSVRFSIQNSEVPISAQMKLSESTSELIKR